MDVELAPALLAGLIGGIAMVVFQVVAALSHRGSFDLLGMWAAFLGLNGQRLVGLVVHLGVSGAIAVLYALGFRLAGATGFGWAWGFVAAIIHWILAGLFVGTVPADRNGGHRAPGPFAMNLGAESAVGFLIGHLAYGVLVGATYFEMHSGAG